VWVLFGNVRGGRHQQESGSRSGDVRVCMHVCWVGL